MGLFSWFASRTAGELSDKLIMNIQKQREVATTISADANQVKFELKQLKRFDRQFSKISRLALQSARKQTRIQLKYQKKIMRAEAQKKAHKVPRLRRWMYLEMLFYSRHYLAKLKKLATKNGGEDQLRVIQSKMWNLFHKISWEIDYLLTVEKGQEANEKGGGAGVGISSVRNR